MSALLSKGTTNAKTVKNAMPTFILYLAPYRTALSSYNVCPMATKGCIESCLFTAGRAGIFPAIQIARIRKTTFFLENQLGFLNQLLSELAKINSKGIKTAIRLNGTSDIDFIKLIRIKLKTDILSFKNLVFYDYTKIPNKIETYKNECYTLTFSRSETNWEFCESVLKAGKNVSALFDHKKPLPKTYNGFKVVDGDKSDIVMMKHKGVILGLKAKGKAKKDTTGFVIRDLNN
jgi:hypothetical protein